MMSKVGAYQPFGLGHEDLYELAAIRVSAKEVERISQTVGSQAEAFHTAEAEASLSDNIIPIKPVPQMYVCMDGTGVPMVKKETAGRKGKGEDGQAKTREAKLGCVFTQTYVDRCGMMSQPATPGQSKRQNFLADGFIRRQCGAAWTGQRMFV
jgi:hypothetical protein